MSSSNQVRNIELIDYLLWPFLFPLPFPLFFPRFLSLSFLASAATRERESILVSCNAPPMMKVKAIKKTIVLLINGFIASLKKMVFVVIFNISNL